MVLSCILSKLWNERESLKRLLTDIYNPSQDDMLAIGDDNSKNSSARFRMPKVMITRCFILSWVSMMREHKRFSNSYPANFNILIN